MSSQGFDVTSVHALNNGHETKIFATRITVEEIRSPCRTADAVEMLMQVDTDLASESLANELMQELGTPLVSANVLAGVRDKRPQGSLRLRPNSKIPTQSPRLS